MSDWDEESLAGLRAAAYRWDGRAGAGILAERPLGPVLQYAGDVLVVALRQGVPGVEQPARKCIEELDGRGLPGDAELAAELAAALGGSRNGVELAVVPVDLGTLGSELDGAPADGARVVDLRRGDVMPVGEEGPAFDEGSPEYDPDRWLTFWPESGAAHRDMVSFTASVDDEGLRERLTRALTGRGAFRRFGDVLRDTPEGLQWRLFQEERQRGRARKWLADQGYRPGPRSL